VPVFRWFNAHLKGADPVIDMAATKFFAPQELKVFEPLPADAINTNIAETFVPMAKNHELPRSKEQWEKQRDAWMAGLKAKSFAGWPSNDIPLELEKKFDVTREGLRFQAYDFTSQPSVRLRLYLLSKAELTKPQPVVLNIMDQNEYALRETLKTSDIFPYPVWLSVMRNGFPEELAEEVAAPNIGFPDPRGMENAFKNLKWKLGTANLLQAYVAPRGMGLDTWAGNEKKQVQIRRRFMLLGQTLDAMRVWDVRRALQALRQVTARIEGPIDLQAENFSACYALYASLFEPHLRRLDLRNVPGSHSQGPDYLNVLRVTDIPQAAAMAAERCRVSVQSEAEPSNWVYPAFIPGALGWPKDSFSFAPGAPFIVH
jgi:hypothetical protein